MLRKDTKQDLILVLIIGIVVFLSVNVYLQYRHFYSFSGYTFTVWKRWGGTCYVMPYKYTGLTPPEKDYLTVSNVGSLTIFIKPDSTLVFFDGIDVFKVSFENYKYERVKWEEKDYNQKWYEYIKIYPYIRFYFRELHVETSQQ